MFTDRLLLGRRDIGLTAAEREKIEGAIAEVRAVPPRTTIVRIEEPVTHSTLLVEGFMCRFLDDRDGLRQLVGIHVPGDFVDLHAYPLQHLDHNVGSLTACTTAIVPHQRITELVAAEPGLGRKLWAATLLDASMHRAWLFRLGRLDAAGRVAHFISELNARLCAVGLSDGRRFTIGMTQADLAEACGLTTVHTNRVTRVLREAGLCTFRSPLIEISDPDGLAKRGQFDPRYLYFS